MTNTPNKEPWRDHLILSGSSGSPKPWLANAITALRECLVWRDCFAFDEFAQQTTLMDSPPWGTDLVWEPRAWTPQDDRLVTKWLQDQA